jgi:hypothetical protein
MARNRGQQPHPKNLEGGHINWFATADSQAAHVIDWDVHEPTVWAAIAGVLAAGNAIQLGMSMDGASMYVRIYDNETNPRKWIADSVELDQLMKVIANAGQLARRGHIPARLQAIGD